MVPGSGIIESFRFDYENEYDYEILMLKTANSTVMSFLFDTTCSETNSLSKSKTSTDLREKLEKRKCRTRSSKIFALQPESGSGRFGRGPRGSPGLNPSFLRHWFP